MAGLANFQIDTTDPLTPVVRVNGEDVTGYTRVSLDVQIGQVPRLFLEMPAEAGIIEGTGVVVQMVEGPPPEALDVLSDFFGGLDAGQFEAAMLDAFDEPGVETTGQAALHVLKGWVKRG